MRRLRTAVARQSVSGSRPGRSNMASQGGSLVLVIEGLLIDCEDLATMSSFWCQELDFEYVRTGPSGGYLLAATAPPPTWWPPPPRTQASARPLPATSPLRLPLQRNCGPAPRASCPTHEPRQHRRAVRALAQKNLRALSAPRLVRRDLARRPRLPHLPRQGPTRPWTLRRLRHRPCAPRPAARRPCADMHGLRGLHHLIPLRRLRTRGQASRPAPLHPLHLR